MENMIIGLAFCLNFAEPEPERYFKRSTFDALPIIKTKTFYGCIRYDFVKRRNEEASLMIQYKKKYGC